MSGKRPEGDPEEPSHTRAAESLQPEEQAPAHNGPGKVSGPGGLPGLLKGHGKYILGILLLLLVLSWLTFDEIHPDIPLVLVVALIAVVYRVVTTSPRFSPQARENLVFVSLGVGIVVILGIVSGWSNPFLLLTLTTVLVYAVFALGLNLEFGYTGIINFGHVAFMAIGAYTFAVFSKPMVDHAGALTRSTWPTTLVLVALAAAAFVVMGVMASILAERLFARWPREGPGRDHRQRTVLAGGLVGGFAAIVVVLVVPYPMTTMWAETMIVGAGALLGMVVAAFAGVLLGLPTLRLRADYLAIVTIGAAEILRRAIRNEQWLTNGPQGIPQLPRPFRQARGEWEWLQHVSGALDVIPYRLLLFLIALAALGLVLVTYLVLLRSPYGRVLRAIREDEDVASALGKNVFAYKLQAMALGGAVAGLAGALLAWQRPFISPNTFEPIVTFWAWIIIVVGGVGNNKGTVLGALILFAFFAVTRELNLEENLGLSGPQTAAFRASLIGLLLILLMLFKPEGLLGKREELVLGD